MKSNIAFIDRTMERAGQYSSKNRAKEHANTIINRRHLVVKTNCYRMYGDEVITFQCYTLVLQN